MNSGKFSAFELKPGQWYQVVAEFVDFDRRVHPVGECWRYCDRNFFPHEAGLTLNVEGEGLKSIRLQDYVGVQREIIDAFSEYVVEIEQPE
jgi:hypothetical protein